MNGELYHACCLVAAAKNALLESKEIDNTASLHEKYIEFHLLPEAQNLDVRLIVSDRSNWYQACLSRGLNDIKLMTPPIIEDRNLLGFSGATQIAFVCFYRDGTITCFTPHWSFVDELKGWRIVYTEDLWDNAPTEKPRFCNPKENFIQVLKEIGDFADTIGFSGFADRFNLALQILLTTNSELDLPYLDIPSPDLPPENLRLFLAAQKSYVFGAMGSWNDSPPWIAHEMGLDAQYEDLSARLFTQVILSILYAINEW